MLKRRLSALALTLTLVASQTVTVMASSAPAEDNYSAYDRVTENPDDAINNIKKISDGNSNVDKQTERLVFDENDNVLTDLSNYPHNDAYYKEDSGTLHDMATSESIDALSNANVSHISSTGLDAYQQVKAGIFSGDMSYEAMAGVPTTEDLFVEYGGSQYLVDLDYRLCNGNYERDYNFKANTYNYLYFYTPFGYDHKQDGTQLHEWKNEDTADRVIQYHYITEDDSSIKMNIDPVTYTHRNAAMSAYKEEDNSAYQDLTLANWGNPDDGVSKGTNRYTYAKYNSQFDGSESLSTANRYYSTAVSEAICFKRAAMNGVDKLAEGVCKLDDNYRKDEGEWNWEPGDKFDSEGNMVRVPNQTSLGNYMFTYGGIVRLSKQAYNNAEPADGDYSTLQNGLNGDAIVNAQNVTVPTEQDSLLGMKRRSVLCNPYFMTYLYDKDGVEANGDSKVTTLDTWGNTSEADVKRLFSTIYSANGMLKDNTALLDDTNAKYYCVSTNQDGSYSQDAVVDNDVSTLSYTDATLNEARFNACFAGGNYKDAYDWTCHDYTNTTTPDMNIAGQVEGATNDFNYNEICNLYYKDIYAILYYLDSMFYSDEPCLCPNLPGHVHSSPQRDKYVTQVLAYTFNTHQHGDNSKVTGSYNFTLTLPLAILPPGGDLDASTDRTQTDYVVDNGSSFTDTIGVNNLYNQFYYSPQYAYGLNMRVECDYGFDYSQYYKYDEDNDYYYSTLSYNTDDELKNASKQLIDGRTYTFGRVYNTDFSTMDSKCAHLVYPVVSDLSRDNYSSDTPVRYEEYYPISSFSFVDADFSQNVNGYDYYGNFVRDNTWLKTLSYNHTVKQIFENVRWLDVVGYRIYHINSGESEGLSDLLVDRGNIHNMLYYTYDTTQDPNAWQIVTQAIAQKGYIVYDVTDRNNDDTARRGTNDGSYVKLGTFTNLDTNGRLANSFYPMSEGNEDGLRMAHKLNGYTDTHYMYAYKIGDVPEIQQYQFVNDDPQAFILDSIGYEDNVTDTNDDKDRLNFVYKPMSQGGRSHTSFWGFVNQALAHTLLYRSELRNGTEVAIRDTGYFEKGEGALKCYKNSLLVQGDFVAKGYVTDFEAKGNTGILKRYDSGESAKLNLLCGSVFDSWRKTSDKDVFNILTNESMNALSEYLSCDSWIPAKFNRIHSRNNFKPQSLSDTNDIMMLLTHSYGINDSTHSVTDFIEEDAITTNRKVNSASDLGKINTVHKLGVLYPQGKTLDFATFNDYNNIRKNVNNPDCLSVSEVEVPKVGYLGDGIGSKYRYTGEAGTNTANGYDGIGVRYGLQLEHMPLSTFVVRCNDANDAVTNYAVSISETVSDRTYFNRFGHGDTNKDIAHNEGDGYISDIDKKEDSFINAYHRYGEDAGKTEELDKANDNHKQKGYWLSMWYPFMQDINTSRFLNNGTYTAGSGQVRYSTLNGNMDGTYTCHNSLLAGYYNDDTITSASPWLSTIYTHGDEKPAPYNYRRTNNFVIYNPIASETAVIAPLGNYRWDEHNMSTSVSENALNTYMGDKYDANGMSVKRNQVIMSRSSENIDTNSLDSEMVMKGSQIWLGVKTGEYKRNYIMRDVSQQSTSTYVKSDYMTQEDDYDVNNETVLNMNLDEPVSITKTGTYEFAVRRGNDYVLAKTELTTGDTVKFENGSIFVSHPELSFSLMYKEFLNAYCTGKGLTWEYDELGNIVLYNNDPLSRYPVTNTTITEDYQIPFNGVYTLSFYNAEGNPGITMRPGDSFYIDLNIYKSDGSSVVNNIVAETNVSNKLDLSVSGDTTLRFKFYCTSPCTLQTLTLSNNTGDDWYVDISPMKTNHDAAFEINTEGLYDLVASLPDSVSGVDYSLTSDITELVYSEESGYSIDWEHSSGSSKFVYNANYIPDDKVYVYTTTGSAGSDSRVITNTNDLRDKFSKYFIDTLDDFINSTYSGKLHLESKTTYRACINPANEDPHKVPSRAWCYYIFGWLAEGVTPITVDNWLDYFDVNGGLLANLNNITDTVGHSWQVSFLQALASGNYGDDAFLAVVCVDNIYYLTIHYTESWYNSQSEEIKQHLGYRSSNDVLSDSFYLVFNAAEVTGTCTLVNFSSDAYPTVHAKTWLSSNEDDYASITGAYQIIYKASAANAVGLSEIAYGVKYSQNINHKYAYDHVNSAVDWEVEAVEIIKPSVIREGSENDLVVNPTYVSLDDEFYIYWDNCTDLLDTNAEVNNQDIVDITTNTISKDIGRGWEFGVECNSDEYLNTDGNGNYINFDPNTSFSKNYNTLSRTANTGDTPYQYGNTNSKRLTDTTKWIGWKYLQFNVDMYAFVKNGTLGITANDVLEVGYQGEVLKYDNSTGTYTPVKNADGSLLILDPSVSAFNTDANGNFIQNIPVLVPAGCRVYLGYQDVAKSVASSNDTSFVDFGYNKVGRVDDANPSLGNATTNSETHNNYCYHFYCPLSDGETEAEATVEFGVDSYNAVKDATRRNVDYTQDVLDYYTSSFNRNFDPVDSRTVNLFYPIYYVERDENDNPKTDGNGNYVYTTDEWGYRWLKGLFGITLRNNLYQVTVEKDANVIPYDDGEYYITNIPGNVNRPTSTRSSDNFAIIGSIGGLSILDSGDPRWQDTFKTPDDMYTGNTQYAISPIVHAVSRYSATQNKAGSQRFVFGDISDVRGRFGKYLFAGNDHLFDDDGLSLDTYQAKWFKSIMYRADNADLANVDSNFIANYKDDKDALNYSLTPLAEVNNIHNSGNLFNILNRESVADQENAKIDCVRLGYLTYLSIDTIGNYYGSNSKRTSSDSEKPVNANEDYGQTKLQIRPVYYLEEADGTLTPVDVYMRSGANYRLINLGLDDFAFKDDIIQNKEYTKDALDTNVFEVANNSYYSYSVETNNKHYSSTEVSDESKFVQSILRYSITSTERTRTTVTTEMAADYRTKIGTADKSAYTKVGKGISVSILDPYAYLSDPGIAGGYLTSYYTYGSAQLMFLREYNRTFVGGGTLALSYDDSGFGNQILNAKQYGQTWYFNLGLPESSVFIRHGEVLNYENMQKMDALRNARIVVFLDVYAIGEKYVLHYDSSLRNVLKTLTPNTNTKWRKWFNIDTHKYLIPVQYYELDNLRSTADKNTLGSH